MVSAPLILVIEDEPMIRALVERALQLFDLRVLSAPNGRQGLELYRQYQAEVTLVLCNVQMPGMDGVQVLTFLRAINPTESACYREQGTTGALTISKALLPGWQVAVS